MPDAALNPWEWIPSWLALEVEPAPEMSLEALHELHALALTMTEEDFDHFVKHIRTNTRLHRFRDRRTGDLAGFQAWRVVEEAPEPLILGGKLRVLPPYRRKGLHLVSGLRFFSDLGSPWSMLRLSVASLFGFASIAKHLSDWQFIDESTPELLDAVVDLACESGYCVDRSTGRVEVGFRLPEEQLRAFPSAFYQSTHAKAYIDRSPTWQSGTFLAFAFRMTPENVAGLERGARARLLPSSCEAPA